MVRKQRRPRASNDRRLDVWLLRFSHIAQVGLFAVTLCTIYFTVIPLYRSAALEESVARQQLELSRLTSQIDKAYLQLRAYALSEFVQAISVECDPLLKHLMSPVDDPDDKVTAEKSYFAMNVKDCLIASLSGSPALLELRPKDRAAVELAVHSAPIRFPTSNNASSPFTRTSTIGPFGTPINCPTLGNLDFACSHS